MGKGVEGPQRDAGGMLLGRARAQGVRDLWQATSQYNTEGRFSPCYPHFPAPRGL